MTIIPASEIGHRTVDHTKTMPANVDVDKATFPKMIGLREGADGESTAMS